MARHLQLLQLLVLVALIVFVKYTGPYIRYLTTSVGMPTITAPFKAALHLVVDKWMAIRDVLLCMVCVDAVRIGTYLQSYGAYVLYQSCTLTGQGARLIDPILLKEHSRLEKYKTYEFIWPGIRTFYRPHKDADRLPKHPTPIPLFAFIHGLGGSIAQFEPLIRSLTDVAPTLAIDLPGCGLSYASGEYRSYELAALAELLTCAIKRKLDLASGQKVILIAHDMGCTLAAILAKKPIWLRRNVAGIVAICPRASAFSPEETAEAVSFAGMPTYKLYLYRLWDRLRGIRSRDVVRVTGPDADDETKWAQLRFNAQIRTRVWQFMLLAWHRSLPKVEIWEYMHVPVLLVAGASDEITPPTEASRIKALGGQRPVSPITGGAHNPTGPSLLPNPCDPKFPEYAIVVLPAPAGHALLYSATTARVVANEIRNFVAKHVDERLSITWQLRHLATDKWEVKNLEKWKSVTPVSDPIANTFRAMKTLRQTDEVHAPTHFVEQYKGLIRAVIDISHDKPHYDSAELEAIGIRYRKFATVSKIPPTVQEVENFVGLVDELEKERSVDDGLIGVHCHYGFNRTGFFLVSYLVEKKGWSVKDAIQEFATKRPNGIRHSHFLDELYARYTAKGE
ncbi:dual specificity phosphatase catalytic domain protein [Sporormia fimetaria CBS 119925]|uniref:Dual specificity phosphatase catalytic domain protein n=1 Tax=Sporormia fimetaria CBS 119925 TaxID=1340428 RepID=A0A6A6VD31_9PLEO|nr:dual specificity phosphatase catalytic domain protein [Sporormia fimetaria CBS 119925]